MENFTVAASHYEAAYKIRFGNISIALRLADVYLRNNVPTKATKLLAPVQQAHPNNSEVVYTLGAAYQADGNYRAAEELYLNYHLDHPADTGILQSLYSIYLHLGNSAKAESMRRQIAMRVK
jgi:predicted Zn-dependent protease